MGPAQLTSAASDIDIPASGPVSVAPEERRDLRGLCGSDEDLVVDSVDNKRWKDEIGGTREGC